MSNSQDTTSASHWCRAVIEEAVPKSSTIPPPPVFQPFSLSSLRNPTLTSSKSVAPSLTASTTAAPVSAYTNIYAQYYNSMAQTAQPQVT